MYFVARAAAVASDSPLLSLGEIEGAKSRGMVGRGGLRRAATLLAISLQLPLLYPTGTAATHRGPSSAKLADRSGLTRLASQTSKPSFSAQKSTTCARFQSCIAPGTLATKIAPSFTCVHTEPSPLAYPGAGSANVARLPSCCGLALVRAPAAPRGQPALRSPGVRGSDRKVHARRQRPKPQLHLGPSGDSARCGGRDLHAPSAHSSVWRRRRRHRLRQHDRAGRAHQRRSADDRGSPSERHAAQLGARCVRRLVRAGGTALRLLGRCRRPRERARPTLRVINQLPSEGQGARPTPPTSHRKHARPCSRASAGRHRSRSRGIPSGSRPPAWCLS